MNTVTKGNVWVPGTRRPKFHQTPQDRITWRELVRCVVFGLCFGFILSTVLNDSGLDPVVTENSVTIYTPHLLTMIAEFLMVWVFLVLLKTFFWGWGNVAAHSLSEFFFWTKRAPKIIRLYEIFMMLTLATLIVSSFVHMKNTNIEAEAQIEQEVGALTGVTVTDDQVSRLLIGELDYEPVTEKQVEDALNGKPIVEIITVGTGEDAVEVKTTRDIDKQYLVLTFEVENPIADSFSRKDGK